MKSECKDGACNTQAQPLETEELSMVCEQGMSGSLGIADGTVTPVVEK